MKTEVFNCTTCGEIVREPIFSTQEGAFLVTTKSCKTIQSYAKAYKKQVGTSFFECTGEKISESVGKEIIHLTHIDIDESTEAQEQHSLGKHEVWTDSP